METIRRILDDIDDLLDIHDEPEAEEWIDDSQESPFPLWEPLQVASASSGREEGP